MKLFNSKRPTTILGLTLDGGRLQAAVVRRTNGSVEVQKTVTAALTLDLLHNEAELVGREIRNLLDGAGIREKRCVVGIPLNWALTLHGKLPEIEAADVPGFLEIEAERGFPCSVDELQIATAQHKSPGGDSYATQIGVPRPHLARLETALAAAQLRPLSFSIGIAALPGALPDGTRGAITAVVGDSVVDVLLGCGSGIVALRTLEGVIDTEGADGRIQSDIIAREIRISVGQLPADIRESIRQLHVVGSGRTAQQLTEDIRPRARSLGLTVEALNAYSGPHHGVIVPSGATVSAALSLAVQFVGKAGRGFEFLPPKPTLFQELGSRYSSKRLAWAGAATATAAVVLIGAFAYQQIQLTNLRRQWLGMKPKVDEVTGLHDQIRKYRSWYDESMTSLSILRKVTEAFPEDGVVSAKTIEIHAAVVTCTGVAKDQPSLQKTLDRLSAAKGVAELHRESIKGKAPALQYSFNFKWSGGVQ